MEKDSQKSNNGDAWPGDNANKDAKPQDAHRDNGTAGHVAPSLPLGDNVGTEDAARKPSPTADTPSEIDAHAQYADAPVPDPHDDVDDTTQDVRMTCDVLCSLSAATSSAATDATPHRKSGKRRSSTDAAGKGHTSRRCSGSKAMCPKQHQLPMFLTKTYHMIDRCDTEVATWSETGDNFVVKNVEKFASNVLPLYFKHSNFSSFARQLNFYGFRKLRTDPILTTDVDPRTSCYVRFYHEKFQKDRPELLHHIKRATKSDPHTTKDDMDTLKTELTKCQQTLHLVTQEFDHKLQSVREECNRKLVTLSAEYDQLAALVHQLLAHHQVMQQKLAAQTAAIPVAAATVGKVAEAPVAPAAAVAVAAPAAPPAMGLPMLLPNTPNAAAAAAAAAATDAASAAAVAAPGMPPMRLPSLLSHLSQVASMNLQQHIIPQRPLASITSNMASAQRPASAATAVATAGTKRPFESRDRHAHILPAASKAKPDDKNPKSVI